MKLLRHIPRSPTSDLPPATHVEGLLMSVGVSMYVPFETMSSAVYLCDVHCTAQIGYSWDILWIEGAGVRNYLSLSERGGTTPSRWAGQHSVSLQVACVVLILGPYSSFGLWSYGLNPPNQN